MKDDRAKGGSAHASVGDTHHVFDALACELHWNRKISCLRHAGRALGASVSQDENIVGGDLEIGVVNAIREIFNTVKDDRPAGVVYKDAGGGRVLDNGAIGREVAVEDRHRAFVLERRCEASDDILMRNQLSGCDNLTQRVT